MLSVLCDFLRGFISLCGCALEGVCVRLWWLSCDSAGCCCISGRLENGN